MATPNPKFNDVDINDLGQTNYPDYNLLILYDKETREIYHVSEINEPELEWDNDRKTYYNPDNYGGFPSHW